LADWGVVRAVDGGGSKSSSIVSSSSLFFLCVLTDVVLPLGVPGTELVGDGEESERRSE
jgi:hypothetical protein